MEELLTRLRLDGWNVTIKFDACGGPKIGPWPGYELTAGSPDNSIYYRRYRKLPEELVEDMESLERFYGEVK